MDFAGMSTIEIVVTVFLGLAAVGIRVWLQVGKSKLSLEDQQRLEHVAHQAIAAAEEMGAREGWTGAQKLQFAKETIVGAFPKLDTDSLDVVIHSALAVAPFVSAVNKRISERRADKADDS